MVETLSSLREKDPELAQCMFFSLDECVGCNKNCLTRTWYRLDGKRKAVCHGKLNFTMSLPGLQDAYTFIEEINSLICNNS